MNKHPSEIPNDYTRQVGGQNVAPERPADDGLAGFLKAVGSGLFSLIGFIIVIFVVPIPRFEPIREVIRDLLGLVFG